MRETKSRTLLVIVVVKTFHNRNRRSRRRKERTIETVVDCVGTKVWTMEVNLAVDWKDTRCRLARPAVVVISCD